MVFRRYYTGVEGEEVLQSFCEGFCGTREVSQYTGVRKFLRYSEVVVEVLESFCGTQEVFYIRIRRLLRHSGGVVEVFEGCSQVLRQRHLPASTSLFPQVCCPQNVAVFRSFKALRLNRVYSAL